MLTRSVDEMTLRDAVQPKNLWALERYQDLVGVVIYGREDVGFAQLVTLGTFQCNGFPHAAFTVVERKVMSVISALGGRCRMSSTAEATSEGCISESG